jgi:hypothetical protein
MKPRYDTGDQMAAAIVQVGLILALLVIGAVAILLASAAKELGRVYADHARPGSKYAGPLWWALALLGAVLALCGLLAALLPGIATACAVAAAWSVLAYVVVIEGVAAVAPRPAVSRPSGDLGDYLHWGPAGSNGQDSPSENGRAISASSSANTTHP